MYIEASIYLTKIYNKKHEGNLVYFIVFTALHGIGGCYIAALDRPSPPCRDRMCPTYTSHVENGKSKKETPQERIRWVAREEV